MSKNKPIGKKKPKLPPSGAKQDDFYAYLPSHDYMYAPTRALWPRQTIASILGGDAPAILDRKKPLHGMTWLPGAPMIVTDRGVFKGGWLEKSGHNTFNLYVAPKPITGNADAAGLWRKHAEKLFGADSDHVLDYLAFKVQKPGTKINHALVIGSIKQGIGKDTFFAPVKRAVGDWNFTDVNARQAMDPDHNSFLESVLVRINEAHDLGKQRHSFYDYSKDWMAAPPETLRVSDKWIVAHPIFNVLGCIITTNHKTDGLYLPAEDRRHYVAWSDLEPGDFDDGYWNTMWQWYADGGLENAAAYLATRDVSKFDPHKPPLKTAAFWAMVNAGSSDEDAKLADVLDYLGDGDWLTDPADGRRAALTLDHIKLCPVIDDELLKMFNGGRRALPHKLELAGYTSVRNPDAKDGLWMINGKRQMIYGRADLRERDRLKAARLVTDQGAELTRLAAEAENRAAWKDAVIFEE